MNTLWDSLKTSSLERECFLNGPVQSILYTELGILELDRQVEFLERELKEKSEILKAIQDRLDLIQVRTIIYLCKYAYSLIENDYL